MVRQEGSSETMSDPKLQTTRDDIRTGLDLCQEIDDLVDEGSLPDKASEFVEGVRPKLDSVLEYGALNEYISPKQAEMVQNIVKGLENWTRDHR